MKQIQAIADKASTLLESDGARLWLGRIMASHSADSALAVQFRMQRAPQHYSDELQRDPEAIYRWEIEVLADVARALRHEYNMRARYGWVDDNGWFHAGTEEL